MPTSDRHIDHLVLAVHDLEAAGNFFREIGFQVGTRNRHPWGTENRLIQFKTSFIELIAIGDAGAIPPHAPGRFSFGAFVRDYLQKRQGLAMLVLDSTDAQSDAMAFRQNGVGAFEPFFFERRGRKPDGTETKVAFSLAFAVDPLLPDVAFFRCQQHFPENFWNAEFQVHPNSSFALQSVSLSAQDPLQHAAFFHTFTGAEGIAGPSGKMEYLLAEHGKLVVESRNDASGLFNFEVAVSDFVRTGTALLRGRIPFQNLGSSLTIAAADAFGVQISFTGAR